MKIPTATLYPKNTLLPTPPDQWPTDRNGVIEIANTWYDPSLVAINKTAINDLPQDTILAAAMEDCVMGSAPCTPADYLHQAEATICFGAINHMFWEQEQGKFTRYTFNGLVGALAMSTAFLKAWDDPSSPVRKAREHGIALTVEDVKKVFGYIPVPESRMVILNQILLSPDLRNMAKKSLEIGQSGGNMDVAFASQLADAFPLGYGDEILKKAQLATSDLWRKLRQNGLDTACNVTAFADYQIPNVLRALGLLNYDTDLATHIDAGELIGANSQEERAIRAASILAVDLLSEQQNVAVPDVDYWLWLKRKEPTTLFHRTRTTLY